MNIQLKPNSDKINIISKNNHESEVEYSYDCDTCLFKKFMSFFGVDLNIETCFVDCTKEIKEDTDQIFKLLLDSIYMNKDGAILYLGNLPIDKYKN